MKKTNKVWLGLSLFCTLVALGFHFYLTQKYFSLKFSTAGGMSACNISSFLNCDAVSASRFASFLGRPMALWGFVTNLLFLLVQLAVLWNWFPVPRRGMVLTFLFSLFIGSTSLVMGLISLMMLSQLCLFCIATYILSWISLAIWTGLSLPKFSEILIFIKSVPGQKSTLGILIAIPFLTWIFNTFFMEKNGASPQFDRIVQERLATWHMSPKYDFELNTGLRMGPENSPFVIIEFADFRCPHCKTAYPSLHAFTQAHPKSQLIFKPYPLDGTCNSDPGFQGQGDGISCRLALGVLCAEKSLKKGWELHDFLFENQESLRNANTLEKADAKICSANLGDCQALTDCMNSSEMLNELKGMIQEAIRAQISGTPTIFVNGKLLPGAQVLPILDGAYSQSQ